MLVVMMMRAGPVDLERSVGDMRLGRVALRRRRISEAPLELLNDAPSYVRVMDAMSTLGAGTVRELLPANPRATPRSGPHERRVPPGLTTQAARPR